MTLTHSGYVLPEMQVMNTCIGEITPNLMFSICLFFCNDDCVYFLYRMTVCVSFVD